VLPQCGGQYDEQCAVPMHAFVTVKPGTHVKWYVHVIEEKDGKFEASIKEEMTGSNIWGAVANGYYNIYTRRLS
jgi:hypothetical protein